MSPLFFPSFNHLAPPPSCHMLMSATTASKRIQVHTQEKRRPLVFLWRPGLRLKELGGSFFVWRAGEGLRRLLAQPNLQRGNSANRNNENESGGARLWDEECQYLPRGRCKVCISLAVCGFSCWYTSIPISVRRRRDEHNSSNKPEHRDGPLFKCLSSWRHKQRLLTLIYLVLNMSEFREMQNSETSEGLLMFGKNAPNCLTSLLFMSLSDGATLKKSLICIIISCAVHTI